MTTDVTGYLKIAKEDHLDLSSQIGFTLHQVEGGGTPWLDIFGSVNVSSGWTTIGVDTDTASPLTKLSIETSGKLAVITGGGVAFGVVARAPMDFVNDGELDVTASQNSATGVFAYGRRFEMTNNGDVHVVCDDGSADAFLISTRHAQLTNAGEVVSQGTFARAYMIQGHVNLTNTGVIAANGGATGAEGIAYGGKGGVIDNQGSIIATSPNKADYLAGIELFADGHVTIDNSGTIKAAFAINEENAADIDVTLHNSGKLAGAVRLGIGNDTVDNTGVISRDVHLGGGGDIFAMSGHGHVKGDVFAGDGADSLTGASAADHLNGAKGADVLTGGGGADVLSGGADGDVFVYSALADSTALQSDLITDLDGSDHIDVSGIDANTTAAGDQAFVLVAALSGQAGQLVLSYDAGTNTTSILGDVDGDGIADLVIQAAGDQSGFSSFVL